MYQMARQGTRGDVWDETGVQVKSQLSRALTHGRFMCDKASDIRREILSALSRHFCVFGAFFKIKLQAQQIFLFNAITTLEH